MTTEKAAEADLGETELSASKPSFGIDVDYYQGIIDDPDIPEERKRELIEVIGAIVMNFIDMGFGVHPVQLARLEKDQQQTPQENKEKTLERTDI